MSRCNQQGILTLGVTTRSAARRILETDMQNHTEGNTIDIESMDITRATRSTSSSGCSASRTRQATDGASCRSRKRTVEGKQKRAVKPNLELGINKEHQTGDGTEDEEKNCCICLDEPSALDLAKVNGCDHLFCFACIEKWADRENSCPLCKVRFTKIDRVNKASAKKRKKGESALSKKNTKKVNHRDQRSDLMMGATFQDMFNGEPMSPTLLEMLSSVLGRSRSVRIQRPDGATVIIPPVTNRGAITAGSDWPHFVIGSSSGTRILAAPTASRNSVSGSTQIGDDHRFARIQQYIMVRGRPNVPAIVPEFISAGDAGDTAATAISVDDSSDEE